MMNKNEVTTVTREVPFWASAVSVFGLLSTSLAIIIFTSPYNHWLPRRVFEVPMFTRDECDDIVQRAMAAAQRNADQAETRLLTLEANMMDEKTNATLRTLLDEPRGWQKSRHTAYPTTDLNWVTDPFTSEDRQFLSNLLHRRLSPLMSRIYGIPQGSIRTNDMFVVRYDADKRTRLANHSDDGDISFNILLTDTFHGGGTRFWNRATGEHFAHVEPTQPGMLLAHSALIHHEGYHVSSGTRIILVGFTAIDRVDPWQQTWTGLTWLASYCNLNWMTVKVKDSVHNSGRRLHEQRGQALTWEDNQYVRYLFRDLYEYMKGTVDRTSTHAVESLVAPENHDKFLQALDAGYKPPKNQLEQASWYQGQQIHLNVDGTIDSEWETRSGNLNRFEEL